MTKEFIAVLEDMVKEYELLAKYNGGKDYLRWNVLQACIDEAKDHVSLKRLNEKNVSYAATMRRGQFKRAIQIYAVDI